MRKPIGIRHCAWCGHDFEWHPKIRVTYCSGRCRELAKNDGKSCVIPIRVCRDCGTRIPRLRRFCDDCAIERKRRCDREGKRALAKERPSRPLIMGSCMECGAKFETKLSTRIWCDDRCARRYRKRYRRHVLRQRRTTPTTEWISIRIIGERDGWRCHICGKKVARKEGSIDHLLPLSVGGTHTLRNVSLAHHYCNSIRGAHGTAQLRLIA